MSGAVLVTGAAGFIGSHAVLALADSGRDVVALDNLSAGGTSGRAMADREVFFLRGDFSGPGGFVAGVFGAGNLGGFAFCREHQRAGVAVASAGVLAQQCLEDSVAGEVLRGARNPALCFFIQRGGVWRRGRVGAGGGFSLVADESLRRDEGGRRAAFFGHGADDGGGPGKNRGGVPAIF